MNSGLPSLLDAIFGKQNLALVSLDEIYDVIREFPSFNAGHFLLAKKLRLQDDPGYETESMRTALYFNNPFWLQSLLDDVNHFQPVEGFSPLREVHDDEPLNIDEYPEEVLESIGESSNYTFESYTPIKQPDTEKDELDQETEEILDEKLETDPAHPEETFQYAEPGSQTVTSFDELMAKYNIKPLDLVDETSESPAPVLSVKEELPSEPKAVQETIPPVVETRANNILTPDNDQKQETEEIINEYGIFEETTVKKADHASDSDAFDEQLDQIPFVSDRIIEDPVPAVQIVGSADEPPNTDHVALEGDAVNIPDESTHADDLEVNGNAANTPDESPNPDHVAYQGDAVNTPDDSTHAEDLEVNGNAVNTPDASTYADHVAFEGDAENILEGLTEENKVIFENAGSAEYQESEDPPHKTDEHDYEAFDRPREEPVQIEAPAIEANENSEELLEYNPQNAGEVAEYSNESEAEVNGQMDEQPEQLEEHQKMVSAFNAKNADSIVFTPYHMVDYFASQGIKLVLEDNPPDKFGKQLKSFTDWLKVMKKLPPQTSSFKQDEKENERIRHIAAHSIEERDILTESMAEVLAKQGMYENAIALFQKLSLIYPPKSAYFASRIEQLKASLP